MLICMVKFVLLISLDKSAMLICMDKSVWLICMDKSVILNVKCAILILCVIVSTFQSNILTA